MYLLRLDDASDHWIQGNWHRVHDLCASYGIHPLVAIIPQNEDAAQTRNPIDEEFWCTINAWIDEGWAPGLHGYNHVYDSPHGGLNPVNAMSEFAGKPLDEQREKIRAGQRILVEKGIKPACFVAPLHTFDQNTLEALRLETDIRVVSDTIADDVYFRDGFYYVPQQCGVVRRLDLTLVTFCYHPNTMDESAFERLDEFLAKHGDAFVSFVDVELKRRPLGLRDKALRAMYFGRNKLISIMHGS